LAPHFDNFIKLQHQAISHQGGRILCFYLYIITKYAMYNATLGIDRPSL